MKYCVTDWHQPSPGGQYSKDVQLCPTFCWDFFSHFNFLGLHCLLDGNSDSWMEKKHMNRVKISVTVTLEMSHVWRFSVTTTDQLEVNVLEDTAQRQTLWPTTEELKEVNKKKENTKKD